MSDNYTRALAQAARQSFENHPGSAQLAAQVLTRLEGGTYYEPGLVDAIFQKWSRFPLTMEDAYGFLQVYGELVLGRLRVARIYLGERPERDSKIEENNALLKKLQPQFVAEFWGGTADHDGAFTWHDHLHVGGNINVDGVLVDGPEFTLPAWRASLEVGYQAVAKTMHMIKQQGCVARWPYDSDDIWVIARPHAVQDEEGEVPNWKGGGITTIASSCVRDEDGWPCARTRQAA